MNSDIVAARELAALAAENVRLGVRVATLDTALRQIHDICASGSFPTHGIMEITSAALTPAPSSAGKGGGK